MCCVDLVPQTALTTAVVKSQSQSFTLTSFLPHSFPTTIFLLQLVWRYSYPKAFTSGTDYNVENLVFDNTGYKTIHKCSPNPNKLFFDTTGYMPGKDKN